MLLQRADSYQSIVFLSPIVINCSGNAVDFRTFLTVTSDVASRSERSEPGDCTFISTVDRLPVIIRPLSFNGILRNRKELSFVSDNRISRISSLNHGLDSSERKTMEKRFRIHVTSDIGSGCICFSCCI